MINYLNWLDHNLFEWIQVHLRSKQADLIFLVLRDKFFWMPLYVFLLTWLGFFYKRKLLYWILVAGITVSVSDQLNSSIIKKYFKRIRPCQEEFFKNHFSPVISCSGGYSFPSSHSVNHMTMGTLLFFGLRRSFRNWRWLLLVWALPIGFAQVYIGVHFPFDVLAGWIVGLLLGTLIFVLANRFLQIDQSDQILESSKLKSQAYIS